MSSDDKAPETPARPEQPTTPDTPESKASPNFSLATAWVQGGTRTSAHDNEVAKRKADAERRRNEQDAQRRMAGIPIERGGAKLYSSQFMDQGSPRVIIRYGDMEILCELYKDDVAGDWNLVVTCPECVKNGAPEADAQMRIRQGHRAWHIDTTGAGTSATYIDTDYATGRKVKCMYVRAGTIKDTDILRCSHVACGGAKYRIDNNVMRRVY